MYRHAHECLAVECDMPTSWLQKARDRAQGRGLPCPVVPDKCYNFIRLYMKVYFVKCHIFAILYSQVFYLKQWHWFQPPFFSNPSRLQSLSGCSVSQLENQPPATHPATTRQCVRSTSLQPACHVLRARQSSSVLY